MSEIFSPFLLTKRHPLWTIPREGRASKIATCFANLSGKKKSSASRKEINSPWAISKPKFRAWDTPLFS